MKQKNTFIHGLIIFICFFFLLGALFTLQLDLLSYLKPKEYLEHNDNIPEEKPVIEKNEDSNLSELADFNIREYLNIIPNTLYLFKNEKGEVYEYYFTSIDGDTIKILKKFHDRAYLETVVLTKDNITIDSVSYLENMHRNVFYTEQPIDTYAPIEIFTSPVVKGRKWKSNGYPFEFLKTSYESIVVSGVTYDGYKNEIHYSHTNGIDKIVRYEDNEVITFELVDIQRDYEYEFNLNAYYIDNEQLEVTPINIIWTMYTNYTENDFFTDIFTKSTVEGFNAPLPEGTVVNSIYKAKDLDYVSVDFSEQFNELTTLGSGYEANHIYAVVNTLCDFYKVDKIKLTVNGESYQSGHLYFENDIIERQQ